MPAYKDEKTGKWYCKFYYRDWQGVNRQKLKRGFFTRKNAQDYERYFLEKQASSPQMSFQALYDIYIEDMSFRLKPSTLMTKKQIMESKIVPFFAKKNISEISAADIRHWQNVILDSNHMYSQTYMKTIYSQLSAIINYAIRYYNLPSNPCAQAGSIGRSKADSMDYWTLDEYLIFREGIRNQDTYYMCFEVLYWTGMREGELLALEWKDIDLNRGEISITKTYQRIRRQDVITAPKTKKSRRRIPIPEFLCMELQYYYYRQRERPRGGRVFPKTKYQLGRVLRETCARMGLKRIRVHDIRHSHVSLLISQGFDAAVIAERVGHKQISTTLNTYAHMFPSRQKHLVLTLEELEEIAK